MTIDRIYPILALALLAAATFWLERITRMPESTPRVVRTNPDFIGDGIRMTSFNASGQRHYELLADQVVHYPQSDVTDFERPRLSYQSNEGELRISADRGESTANTEVVHLAGNVVVFREGAGENPDLSMNSDTLMYWPDDQRAFTDDPVVLKHGNISAHGNGLRADNLSGMLELVGDTKVTMPSSKRNRP